MLNIIRIKYIKNKLEYFYVILDNFISYFYKLFIDTQVEIYILFL